MAILIPAPNSKYSLESLLSLSTSKMKKLTLKKNINYFMRIFCYIYVYNIKIPC